MMLHPSSYIPSTMDYNNSSSSSSIHSSSSSRKNDTSGSRSNAQLSKSNAPFSSTKNSKEQTTLNSVTNTLPSKGNSSRSSERSSSEMYNSSSTSSSASASLKTSHHLSSLSDPYTINPNPMMHYLAGGYASPYPYVPYTSSGMIQGHVQPMMPQSELLPASALMPSQLNNSSMSGFMPISTSMYGGYQDPAMMYSESLTSSSLHPYGYIDPSYMFPSQSTTYASVTDSLGRSLLQTPASATGLPPSGYYPGSSPYYPNSMQSSSLSSDSSSSSAPKLSKDGKEKTKIDNSSGTSVDTSQPKSPSNSQNFQGIKPLLVKQQNQIRDLIKFFMIKERKPNTMGAPPPRSTNSSVSAVNQQQIFNQPTMSPVVPYSSSSSSLAKGNDENFQHQTQITPNQTNSSKKRSSKPAIPDVVNTILSSDMSREPSSEPVPLKVDLTPKRSSSVDTTQSKSQSASGRKSGYGRKSNTRGSNAQDEHNQEDVHLNVLGKINSSEVEETAQVTRMTKQSKGPSPRTQSTSKVIIDDDDDDVVSASQSSLKPEPKVKSPEEVLKEKIKELDDDIAFMLFNDSPKFSISKIRSFIDQAKKMGANVDDCPSLQRLLDIDKNVAQWKEKAQKFLVDKFGDNDTKPDLDEARALLETGKELSIADLNEVNILEQNITKALKWRSKCEDKVMSKVADPDAHLPKEVIASLADEGETLPFALPELEELNKLKTRVQFINMAKKILKTIDEESMVSASESRKKWSLIEWDKLNSAYELGISSGVDEQNNLFERIKGAYMRFKRWFERLQSLKKVKGEVTYDTLLELRFVTLTTCVRFPEREEIENALVVVDLVKEANGLITHAKSKKREITKEELDAIWIDAENLGATNPESIASKVEGLSKLLEYLPKASQKSVEASSSASKSRSSRRRESSSSAAVVAVTAATAREEEDNTSTDGDHDDQNRNDDEIENESRKRSRRRSSEKGSTNESTAALHLQSPSPEITKSKATDSKSDPSFPNFCKVSENPKFPNKWRNEEDSGILRVFCHTLVDKYIEIDPFGHDRWYLGKVVLFDPANRLHFVLLYDAPIRLMEIIFFPHGEAWSKDFSNEIDWQFTNRDFDTDDFPTSDDLENNKSLDAIYAAQKVDKRRILGIYISLTLILPPAMASSIQMTYTPPETIVVAVEAYNPRDDLYSILLQNGQNDLLSIEPGNGIARVISDNKKYKWRRMRDTEGFESVYDESYKVQLRQSPALPENEHKSARGAHFVNYERPPKKHRGSTKATTQNASSSSSSSSDKNEEAVGSSLSTSKKRKSTDAENQDKGNDESDEKGVESKTRKRRTADKMMAKEVMEESAVTSLIRIKYMDILRSLLENSANMNIDEAAKLSKDLEIKVFGKHSFNDDDKSEENAIILSEYKKAMNKIRTRGKDDSAYLVKLASRNSLLE